MCGFDGLLMTVDENFMPIAALEIYLLRKLVMFSILLLHAVNLNFSLCRLNLCIDSCIVKPFTHQIEWMDALSVSEFLLLPPNSAKSCTVSVANILNIWH